MGRLDHEPVRFFNAPHPLVAVTGVLVVVAVAVLGFRTGWQPEWFYGVFLVVFIFVFPTVSRRSAKRMRALRQQELERKKHESVLHLND